MNPDILRKNKDVASFCGKQVDMTTTPAENAVNIDLRFENMESDLALSKAMREIGEKVKAEMAAEKEKAATS